MAEIRATGGFFAQDTAKIIRWDGITSGDVTVSHEPHGTLPLAGSISFQGNLGGETISLQASNDATNWHTVSDLDGNPIELTAAGVASALFNFTSAARYFRPTAAGSGVTVDMVLRG